VSESLRRLIRAYHGSPHNFDRFDASKIGTGEGAQAHGYGLYFAGNEDVAYDYRERLGRALTEQEQGEYNRLVDEQQRLSALLRDHYRQYPINVIPPPGHAVERMRLEHLSKQTERALIAMNTKPGHMYEVEIAYPESALLDLDSPVGSQPKAIQEALGEFARAPSHFTFGQDGWRGKNAYMRAAEAGVSQAEASRFFQERGMPGLRYWDGDSRSAGDGNRNYVIFPGAEDGISILRKYGLLPPALAAASQSQGAEMERLPDNKEVLDQMMNAGRMASAIERDPKKAGQLATRAFLNQEQRQGQPLYEYLSQQEQGVVPSDRGAYASAVENSLNRPVISVQYAREKVGDELVPSDSFPSGFLSVRDYINLEGQKAYSQFVRSFKASTGKLTPEVIQMAEQARDRVFRAADDAEGMLAGTLKTNSPYANLMQSTIQQAVAAHSPGGEYAQFGGRTQSEDAEAQQQYGSGSNFMLTSDGRQNYEAQRLLDLWSATDENYGPASTMSQVQRAVGGFTAPIYNTLTGNSTRLAGEELDEIGRMSKPDGKYGYAAEMYYRSANDTPGQETSVYTPEGRSKFVDTEMTTPTGLANATMGNTDYPMANWYQSVGMRAREIPNTIGNWLGGGDKNLIQNLQELRRNYNRTTPVMPDGADSQGFTEIGKQLQSADARMSGYNAAQLGPKMADAWNSTIGLIPGLKTDRFYLPDAAVDALDMPIEAITDPINVSMNVMAPGVGAVKGAITGGANRAGNNLIRSLAKIPTRMGDDAIEEAAQGMALASTMSSPFDYFFPPRTNLLMGEKDPNDKDYDAQLKINTEQAKFDQMDAAERYGRMVGRKK
jgi:hypothetical protein